MRVRSNNDDVITCACVPTMMTSSHAAGLSNITQNHHGKKDQHYDVSECCAVHSVPTAIKVTAAHSSFASTPEYLSISFSNDSPLSILLTSSFLLAVSLLFAHFPAVHARTHAQTHHHTHQHTHTLDMARRPAGY